MAFTQEQESRIRFFFDVAILGKGALAAIEVASGLAVLLVPLSWATHIVLQVFREELLEDPTDFFATHAVQAVSHVSPAAKAFLAFYLLSRGIVKLALVVALVKRKLWAYPVSLGILGLFMLYQIWLVATTGSPLQAALTVLDLFVVWAIWREYRLLRDTMKA